MTAFFWFWKPNKPARLSSPKTISAIEVAGGHILGLIFNKRRQYIPEPFYRWL